MARSVPIPTGWVSRFPGLSAIRPTGSERSDDMDITAPLVEISHVHRGWLARLQRFDPVGPLVLAHGLALAVLGALAYPLEVIATAAVLLGSRVVLVALARQVAQAGRGRIFLVRGVGSLILVSAIVAFDGGTESPLFFSLIFLLVWEAVMNPLRRLILMGISAVVVYVALILAVPDVTVTSLVRLGVFFLFIGLLVWARALYQYWQRVAAETRAVAEGIIEDSPIGFAVYQAGSLRCLFANRVAAGFGLDGRTVMLPYGTSSKPMPVGDVLATVVASSEPQPPTLYVSTSEDGAERFLRIGVAVRQVPESEDWLMVHAEDVTPQVTVGEQHRRFLESANHQFRTPLSPILAYGEMIRRGELSEVQLNEAGAAIEGAARRLEKLLDRISSLLRVERVQNRSVTTISVRDFIDRHLLEADPDLEELLVVGSGADLIMRCDPSPLVGALRELADNARLHGIPPVIINASTVDDRTIVRVSDHGPGPDIEPSTPLDLTWGLLAHPERMPPQMGERLGIPHAYNLVLAAGGTLSFERDQSGWAFVLDVDPG